MQANIGNLSPLKKRSCDDEGLDHSSKLFKIDLNPSIPGIPSPPKTHFPPPPVTAPPPPPPTTTPLNGSAAAFNPQLSFISIANPATPQLIQNSTPTLQQYISPALPYSYSAPPAPTKPSRKIIDVDVKKIVRMRALISSKEAGTVIGRAGSHVNEIREQTGVMVQVTPHVGGIPDRIMTLIGPLEALGRAVALLVRNLVARGPENGETTLRILAPAARMGVIIGKQGIKIKEVQAQAGCHMFTSQENLPNSTERVVTMIGNADSLQIAVFSLAVIYGDYHERTDLHKENYILYDPGSKPQFDPTHKNLLSPNPPPFPPQGNLTTGISQSSQNQATHPQGTDAQAAAMYAQYYPQMQMQMQMMAQNPQYQAQYQQYQQYQQYYAQQAAAYAAQPKTIPSTQDGSQDQMAQIQLQYQQYQQSGQASTAANTSINPVINTTPTPEQTAAIQQQYLQFYNQQHYPGNKVVGDSESQDINVPAGMVGAIIGKGGSNIKEMRTITGCQIKFADPVPGAAERRVTITGSNQSCIKAIELIRLKVQNETARQLKRTQI